MDIKQEKELVTRAKSDPQAFGSLYDAYYSNIYSYALKRTASVSVSLDITSNTFFNALRNINKFQWRDVPFSAWLYRIAANEITNYFRSNGHHEVSLDCLADFDIVSEEQSESVANLEKQSDFLAVHAVVSLLPIKYREVVMLRYFDDLQMSEISERLGKSEGTVKSLLHRGLEKLRVLVKQDATFDRPVPF